MVKGVKFRRGTTVEHSSFTGAEGEITIDTDKDIAVVHDGTTVGGKELVGVAATQAITNKTLISATNVSATNVSATNATVSGVTTFTNGPVLIGTGTSTGTASQRLQVTGGAYFNGLVGLGTTNPTVTLQLAPTGNISNQGTSVLSSTVGAAYTVAQFYHQNGNVSYLRIKATRNATGSDWFSASTKLLQVIDVTEQGYVEFNPNGTSYGLAFGSGTTEWARFTQAGSLGIGTTNPSSILDVRGNLAVTGLSTSRNLTVVGVTTSSTINDSKGDVRSIPQNSQTSSYPLVASDAGKHISITTGGVTVDASIFSVGDVVTVFNNSGSSQSITQGSNVTLRLAATATTGTRTLAQYGICTILCVTGGANPVFVVSGAGLT